jgi:predicted RNase H-like HicB family nuclease
MDLVESSVSHLSGSYYDYESDSATDLEESFGRLSLILHGEAFEGWVFNAPLVVYLECDDGNFIFSDDLFGIYGHGETRTKAFEDYAVALTEYYALLKKHEGADAQSREAFAQLACFFSPKNEAQRNREQFKK